MHIDEIDSKSGGPDQLVKTVRSCMVNGPPAANQEMDKGFDRVK